MNIIVMGPAGSGKGTLAKALSEQLRLATFDTGAKLRELGRSGREEYAWLAKWLDGGNVVTDDIVVSLLKQEVTTVPKGQNGWVIDGTPRNKTQAEYMYDLHREGALPITQVFVLEGSMDLFEQRLLNRRVCEECNTSYNLLTQPPRQEGGCDNGCRGNLVTRGDDHPEGIRKRFQLFDELTAPGIDFFERTLPDRLFTRLDANREAAEVTAEALSVIRGRRERTEEGNRRITRAGR